MLPYCESTEAWGDKKEKYFYFTLVNVVSK